jgi:hypothetical protein
METPAKGDIRANEGHLELYNGERWLKLSEGGFKDEHTYKVSCNSSTIDPQSGICSICGAQWRLVKGHGSYWELSD